MEGQSISLLVFGDVLSGGRELNTPFNSFDENAPIDQPDWNNTLSLFCDGAKRHPNGLLATSLDVNLPYIYAPSDHPAEQIIGLFAESEDRGVIKWRLSTVFAYEWVSLVDDLLLVIQRSANGRFRDETRVRMKISLQEAISNAILHGNLALGSMSEPPFDCDIDRFYDEADARIKQRGLASRLLGIDVSFKEKFIRIKVADEGMCPSDTPSRIDDPMSLSGRGTFLMHANSDRLEVWDRPTTVVMEFNW